MGKKGKKGKGKKEEVQEEEEIPEEFRDLSIPMLREKIQSLTYRLTKVAKERNYMQLENDMVHRFYEITKGEVAQLDAEIKNKCSKMEMIERDHRTHLTVYEQKVLNLEYEHKNNRRNVHTEGDEALAAEKEVHKEKIQQHSSEKDAYRAEVQARRLADQEDIKMLKVGFERNLQKLRETFVANHAQLEQNYQQQIAQLKVDLELKRKAEIHEIEERKGQHINDLLYNHQESFEQIKTYYNDITHDNLQLIRSLKQEIANMKDQEKANMKRMQALTVGNKNLTEPLKQKQAMRQELSHHLKSYAKDKIALKNLAARTIYLEEVIADKKSEHRETEGTLRKVEKERDDLYNRFAQGVTEITKKSDYRNAILEKKLELLTGEFSQKQAQLSEVLKAAALDPSVVQTVTKKLENVLGSKNVLIKDLEYQIHLATKSYNDTIRTYERKLQDLGVPAEEIGFEQIPSVTSQVSAGLVAKKD